MLTDVSQRLKIALNNGNHKQARINGAIPLQHVNHARLNHQGLVLSVHVAGLMNCGEGLIVFQVMLSSHDFEAQNLVIIVQNLELFGAALRLKSGDHAKLSCTPHGVEDKLPSSKACHIEIKA